MIVLDTQVVSEVMKKQPSEAVLAFLDRHPEEVFYITTITVAEIYGGVAKNRDPDQRADLTPWAEAMFAMLRGRVLPGQRQAQRRMFAGGYTYHPGEGWHSGLVSQVGVLSVRLIQMELSVSKGRPQ